MWILSRVNNDTKVYLLCDKPKYTVGRNKTCDIIGEASQSSLGRLHATLHPYNDRVEIIDAQSKYGTYVNDQITTNVKLEANKSHQLTDGDTIRFGFIDFIWKLEKINIVALTSTLTDREKENLKNDIFSLGGELLDQWSNKCTHLVVQNLTFTVKVLQSLCHAIPIVKPEYFRTLLLSIRNQSPQPRVDQFEPEVVERLFGNSVSLQVNTDRKRLFAGKTFVFVSSRHMDQFQGIIECGMGECSSLDKKKWQRRSLVKPGIIVINNSTSSTQSQTATQTLNELNDFLRSKGCRMIPESEISLAILHCSLEKFCNPMHTLKDNFQSTLQIVPSTLLANDTPANQKEVVATETMSSINIPETIERLNSMTSTIDKAQDIIDLIDDDDAMLVQCLDETMKNTDVSKIKRKNSISNLNDLEPLRKKPHFQDDENVVKKIESTSNHMAFKAPQCKSVKSVELDSKPKFTEKSKSNTTVNKTPSPPQSKQQATTSSANSLLGQNSESQKQEILLNKSQFTSSQVQTSRRKRIAHRPFSSTFNNNDSDSDEELFKFGNQPLTKKPKRSNKSDSDSDDNMSYPATISSTPIVAPSIPSQIFTQSSQAVSGSWLSRPTPSQTVGTSSVRPKPKQRNDIVPKPNAVNASVGWEIGQFFIATQPIRIPTQGWYSKDTIKSKSLCQESMHEIKKEDNEKSLLDQANWIESIKSGIHVITKSMNLISTGGKVFKKQRFIAPKEIIKTSKIYEF